MKNLIKAAMAASFLVLTSCAYSMHEVHISDFSPGAAMKDGQMVQGKGEQFVVLGFTGDTQYVDQARQNLMDACPQGRITGISTQFSTSLGFFSWTNKILMQGLCLKN